MENADEQKKVRPVRASKKGEGRKEREESDSHQTTKHDREHALVRC